MDQTVSSAEEGYRSYRRRFLATLGRMAMGGYAVPPSDGLEIVHDFFLEAWPGLRAHYDPSKGEASRYILGAFVRFARPRVVRSAKWRRHLLPPAELAAAVDPAASPDTREAWLDAGTVRRAMDALSPAHRWVLEDRLGAGRSEREAAQRFGLSRYRLREACAEALGRLSVAIDERGVINTTEWPLARALWAEESTLPEAAERLGLTREQAKRARERILGALATAVAAMGVSDKENERCVMNELCSLWREFLANPHGVEIAQRARARADELLDHVDSCEGCLGVAEGAGDPTSIYAALAPPDEELSPQDAETLHDLLQARQADDAEVERAIEDALLPSLGGELANLDELGPDMTPLRLFLATEAVSMLVHRAVRPAGARDDGQLLLTSHGAITSDRGVLVDPDVVVGEIAHVAGISRATAKKLATWWIPRAARRQPLLFVGIHCEPSGRGDVRIELSARDTGEDLLVRWSPRAAERSEQLVAADDGGALAFDRGRP